MKVKYVKKGFGHEVGDVINTTSKVANTLLRREICEVFEEKADEQAAAEQAAAEQAAAEQAAAEQAKTEVSEKLKITDVATIDYADMKVIVAVLGLEVADQKKVTLAEALSEYKSTL